METFRNFGLPVSEIYQVIKLGAQTLIVGLGVFGNLYSIYCIATKSKLQRVTNLFLTVISAALILQALNASIDYASHVYLFAYDSKDDYYFVKPFWCKTWNMLNVYLPSMLAFLCFFAILDRFLILEQPGVHSKIMNRFTVIPMVVLSFLYPALVAIPPISLNWHSDDPEIHPHECKFKITRQYALISPLFTFWVPMALDIFIIVRLFKAMERHDRALAIVLIERGGGGGPLSKPEEAARERAVNALPWGEDQIRRQHRLAITLWSVYWNISIFWIPQHVWQVVYTMTGANWPRATNFIPWFGYMPSAILPSLLYYYDIYDL